MSDEPYIAVLFGFQDDKTVHHGDPLTIPASASVETAIAEAVRWATELHKEIGTKAMLVVNKGGSGVFMQAFDEESEQRS